MMLSKRINMDKIKLCEGQVPCTYVIDAIELPLQTEKRLEALGLTHGTPIYVINRKGRGTMIVRIRGTRFALGYGITKNIQVKEVTQ